MKVAAHARAGKLHRKPPHPHCPSPSQQHYCIAVGVKDSSGLLSRFGLPQFAQPQVPLPQSAGLGAGGMRPPPPRFMM